MFLSSDSSNALSLVNKTNKQTNKKQSIKSIGLWNQSDLGSRLDLATYQQCDPGQLTQSLCTSLVSTVISVLTHGISFDPHNNPIRLLSPAQR